MRKKSSRKNRSRHRRSGSRKGPRAGTRRGTLKLLSIKKSPKKNKKYVATFSRNGRIKQTHFGAKGYQNYGGVGKERHLSEARKKRYIQRHKGKENWNDPTTAGSLSRWVLWDKKSFSEGVRSFKKRFNL
jgi:hypothetical protein